jgi:hypothetical protein
MNVANAPGNKCHAGKLGECLKMISGGLPVDYVGATGVELDAVGTSKRFICRARGYCRCNLNSRSP